MKKIYAISDNPITCMGLGLAQVSSLLARTPEDLQQLLSNIKTADPGLIIISESLATKGERILEEYRQKNQLPLITIIPDPEPLAGSNTEKR